MRDAKRLERSDFKLLPKENSRVYGRFFSLHSFIGVKSEPAFTCVVSKKVAPLATARNQIKRRCREAVREVLRGVREPIALVFRARKEARGASYQDIRLDVQSLVERMVEWGSMRQ